MTHLRTEDADTPGFLNNDAACEMLRADVSEKRLCRWCASEMRWLPHGKGAAFLCTGEQAPNGQSCDGSAPLPTPGLG